MEFKEIPFKNPNASRVYKDYIDRIQQAVRALDKENRQEVLLEINSHIYEGLAERTETEDETGKLLDVLEKLGQPDVFLKPLVAEKKLEEATKTFNPLKVAKALILNIGNGISYVVFAILYLFLFAFVFLIIAKMVNPEHVGFFYRPNELFVLGQYRDQYGVSYTQYEQLGNWFIPVMAASAGIFYVILTLLLKLKRTLKSRVN